MGVSFPFAVIVVVFGLCLSRSALCRFWPALIYFLLSEGYAQTCLSPFAEAADGR